MSRVTRAQMAAEFRRSFDWIRTQEVEFICHTFPNTPAGRACQEVVRQRMDPDSRFGPYYSLETWLARQRIGTKAQRLDRKLMREYRLRWVDALIKEFSK
jgi:hypothetical protein